MLSFKFGTVGSPSSMPKKPGGTVGGIQYTREIGLDALEMAWVQGVRVSEKTCLAIKDTALENKVSLSVHGPYYINLNCDVEKWPKQRKYLMDAAYYGNLAGATDIVFHPGTYFGRPLEEVFEVVLPRLKGCQEEIRANGNPVNLRPETMGKSAVIGSVEDSIVMAKAVPGVSVCIDFAHLHARPGDGSVNTYEEWKQILDLYRKELGVEFMEKLHIHLSGIAYGPKGERNHLVYEEADLDYGAIMRALKDSGGKGRILCESPVMEVDAFKFRDLWMEISGETLD